MNYYIKLISSPSLIGIRNIALGLAIILMTAALSQEAASVDSFEDFIVRAATPYTDSTSVYRLTFNLEPEVYAKLHKARLVFDFPDGFGLQSVDSVSFVSGPLELLYRVDEFSIKGHSVEIRLRKLNDGGNDDGDDGGHWNLGAGVERVGMEVGLFNVVNPHMAGQYQITGTAYKRERILAGPSESEPFEIIEPSVGTKPILQIISTELIAPNSPKVNTNQDFIIEVLLVNVSNVTAHYVNVGLMSDGASNFNSPKTIELLEPNDTSIVVFEITAASESSTENFEAGIVSSNVIELEAVDNAAMAIIQKPANLVLSSSIPDGDSLFVTWDEPYSFSFLIENLGESSVGRGRYHIMSTDSLGEEGHFGFYIAVGIPVEFNMRARPFDHFLYINFDITEIPVDSNTGEPAIINDESISFAIVVRQAVEEPFAQSFIVENNPFNPLDGPVTFVYNLASASEVDFKIFTITGEVVYTDKFIFGSKGGKAGTNQIQWDGRNNAGEMVLNGVYVPTLNVLATGEKASLKLAVLK